jgi:CRP-like cAMP-binding protein
MLMESHLHGIRDRMLALRSLPNYASLRDESLLYIAEHARERRFRNGETLLEEGRPVDRIYIVITGKVTINRRGKLFTVIEAPGGVGVLGALAHDPEGWHAVANVDTITLEIPVTAFIANLEDDYALLRNSLRILSMQALRSRGNLPLHPARAKPVELGTYPDREPTLVERIIALRANASPFMNANMDAIIEIARRMKLMHFDEGATLFEIGEPSTYSLRVNYGHIRCTAPNGESVDVGNEFVLGALDAFAGRPRSYTAKAMSKIVCYRTPIEDFLAVIEMHPSVGLTLCRGLATSLIAR